MCGNRLHAPYFATLLKPICCFSRSASPLMTRSNNCFCNRCPPALRNRRSNCTRGRGAVAGVFLSLRVRHLLVSSFLSHYYYVAANEIVRDDDAHTRSWLLSFCGLARRIRLIVIAKCYHIFGSYHKLHGTEREEAAECFKFSVQPRKDE